MSEPSEKESGALRARARERIEQGRLPRARAVRTWGGRGNGLRCDLYDTAITSDEPEFELQLEVIPTGEPVRFHRLCHALWNEAREDCEPGGWRPVSRELPPPGILVEARIIFGARRSIILNVICLSDESTVPPAWLNATTQGPLPEGWLPIEWRPTPGASSASHFEGSSGSGSKAPSDTNTGAAA
jgi:hypothetical protein